MPKRNISLKHSLDQLDYHLIRELQQNARVSASVLARKLNANERTIRNRIEHLLADGIVRLTAIVNPYAFDYVVAVDIFLETDLADEDKVLAELLAKPEITYLAYGQNSTELSIEARFKDNDQMRVFLGKTLPAIAGLHVKGYTLVPRILRNIDEWMPPIDEFDNP